jgi:hypothetical protein
LPVYELAVGRDIAAPFGKDPGYVMDKARAVGTGYTKKVFISVVQVHEKDASVIIGQLWKSASGGKEQLTRRGMDIKKG